MKSLEIYLNSKYADYYFKGASDCEYVLTFIELPDVFYVFNALFFN